MRVCIDHVAIAYTLRHNNTYLQRLVSHVEISNASIVSANDRRLHTRAHTSRQSPHTHSSASLTSISTTYARILLGCAPSRCTDASSVGANTARAFVVAADNTDGDETARGSEGAPGAGAACTTHTRAITQHTTQTHHTRNTVTLSSLTDLAFSLCVRCCPLESDSVPLCFEDARPDDAGAGDEEVCGDGVWLTRNVSDDG
jgi:hypothetical protein